MPQYGSVDAVAGSSAVSGPGGPGGEVDGFTAPTTLRARLEAHMQVQVDRHWADLILLISYVATGLLDSSAVVVWGSFVSMQTGNTVYLGLGLAAPAESRRWMKALTSLSFFCLGSFCFSRYHRHFSQKRRWVLVCSFLLQAVLVGCAAAIVHLDTAAVKSETRWQVMVPIALIAFQSSAQAMTSRALEYKSFTSVVLTSIYCDLFADPRLFAADNAERNRRAAAPLLLLTGAVLGGKWGHSGYGMTGALLSAMALKAAMVLAWCVWPAERAAVEAEAAEAAEAATEVTVEATAPKHPK